MDNTISNEFLSYLIKIYSYRAKFYALSDDIDENIRLKYEIFAIDTDMVLFMHNMLLGKDTETFSITIDYNMPFSSVIKQIAEFSDSLTKSIKAKNAEISIKNVHFDNYLQKRCNYLPNEAFMAKDIARNSKDGKLHINFERWDRDIQAFTLSRKKKMEDKLIVYAMEYIDIIGTYTETQMNYAYNRVASHISHASKLIQSAEKGIFPYITD